MVCLAVCLKISIYICISLHIYIPNGIGNDVTYKKEEKVQTECGGGINKAIFSNMVI